MLSSTILSIVDKLLAIASENASRTLVPDQEDDLYALDAQLGDECARLGVPLPRAAEMKGDPTMIGFLPNSKMPYQILLHPHNAPARDLGPTVRRGTVYMLLSPMIQWVDSMHALRGTAKFRIAEAKGRGKPSAKGGSSSSPDAGGAGSAAEPKGLGGGQGTIPSPRRDRDDLGELLRIGPNAKRIADAIGVPRTTLLGWIKFREQYDRLKNEGVGAKRRRRRGRRAGPSDFEIQDDK